MRQKKQHTAGKSQGSNQTAGPRAVQGRTMAIDMSRTTSRITWQEPGSVCGGGNISMGKTIRLEQSRTIRATRASGYTHTARITMVRCDKTGEDTKEWSRCLENRCESMGNAGRKSIIVGVGVEMREFSVHGR